MAGIPLHPLVVHFPVVLVILLPISALVALWAIRRGTPSRRAWLVPFAVAAGLLASAWVATQTGESQEDKVEKVVSESALHGHEEAAERFLVLSGALLLVAGVGLVGGTIGRAGRIVATAGSLGLIAAGVQVGHSGGELVYVHGAASAYSTDAGPVGSVGSAERTSRGDDDDR